MDGTSRFIAEALWFIFFASALVVIVTLLFMWMTNVAWDDWSFGVPEGHLLFP